MKKSIFCLTVLGLLSVGHVFGATVVINDDNVVVEEVIEDNASEYYVEDSTNTETSELAPVPVLEPVVEPIIEPVVAPVVEPVVESTPIPEVVPVPQEPIVEEVPVIAPAPVVESVPEVVVPQVSEEDNLWQLTQSQNTIEAYMLYLQTSKEHKYALQADEAITQLKTQQDNVLWVKAKMTNTVQSYEEYLHNSTMQTFATQAAEAIQQLRNGEESKLWRQAQSMNTIEAYDNYLNTSTLQLYAVQAFEAIKNIKARNEEVMWQETINLNTVAAYESYLNAAPLKKYVQQAKDKIAELQAEAAWEDVKNTMNKSYIHTFIQQYPQSPYRAIAEKRVHEITAIDFCNNRQWKSAITEFDAAGGKDQLSPTGLFYYDLCMSELDYQRIQNETNQARLFEFLSKYPNSEHTNEVSNKLALFQSYKFNDLSTEYDYEQALSFAKDDETKAIVEKEIARSKKEVLDTQKQEARKARKDRVAQNGGVVNFGFDLLEVGMQMPMKPEYNSILGPMYYNFGMNLRFGNFKSPFQFAFGAKIGYNFTYKYFIEDSGEEFKVSEIKDNLQLPVFAKMKVNLYSGEKSALYIQGTGAYYVNLTKKENDAQDIHKGSIAFGVGLAGKHTDWDIISFGHDMQLDENNKFIGSNFRIYTALSFYITKKVKTKK